MQKHSRFLIIDAFSSGKAYIAALKQRGFHVVHLISNASLLDAYGRPPDDVDECYVAANFDDALARLHHIQFDYAICGSEPGVQLFNHISFDPSSSMYNPPSLASARVEKFSMANSVKADRINIIPHHCGDDICQFIEFWNVYGPKIILKPNHSAGSDQVYLCEDEKQIEEAFESIYGKINALGRLNKVVYAQQYIHGQQYIVNGICSKGHVCFTDIWKDVREINHGKSYLDYEELLPVASVDASAKIKFAKKILKSIGILNGPFHMELIEHDDEIFLIEVGARIMGAMSDIAYRRILNLSPTEVHIDQILSRNLPNQPVSHDSVVRCVTIRSFTDGILNISLETFLQSLASFRGSYGLVQQNSLVRKYESMFDSLGTVYLSGNTENVEYDYSCIRKMEIVKESVTSLETKLS